MNIFGLSFVLYTPVCYCIIYKILLLVYKALKGAAPCYIKDTTLNEHKILFSAPSVDS